ncbi:bifunctional DNA primase/polymerase [Streptomyces iconiensis]|uniref:Bifunctional DNA primase/polymerase n=1 Tax=Streptomyces iconiensis TaxID=1384038 RepID=A0ABT6ZYB3_9ACTN|nr:bifunctional DNA primase/polymerase [Streptomyces iconiensis]MDJ1134056.1 bifunctional DNA primase/polymerase [Streptomyces iconiensis]
MVVEATIEVTRGVTTSAHSPQQRSQSLLEHAVRYAQERAWDVFPGTWLEAVDGVPRCVCGASGCAAPGAHPTSSDWAGEATGSANTARRMWTSEPRASVLLPTGRAFDALEVSEAVGCFALARLERMEQSLGPVTFTPDGRMHFFVLPGATAKVPDTVRRLGWSPTSIDLSARGEGDWVAAPPSRLGTRGSVQWARQPTAANRWLPDATELVPALAYACGREAAASRER